jgi:hypothetical protein
MLLISKDYSSQSILAFTKFARATVQLVQRQKQDHYNETSADFLKELESYAQREVLLPTHILRINWILKFFARKFWSGTIKELAMTDPFMLEEKPEIDFPTRAHTWEAQMIEKDTVDRIINCIDRSCSQKNSAEPDIGRFEPYGKFDDPNIWPENAVE